MATNQFVARNGIISLSDEQITGSLFVSGTIVKITGSLNVLGGITGSLLGTAISASYAVSSSFSQTASYAVVFPYSGSAQITGSLSVSGSVNITGSLALNQATAPATNSPILTVTGNVSASSALAQGTIFTPTLTAAANNDVLVGLDVNPTFTNGAFTGVTNYAAIIRGTTNTNFFSSGNVGINQSTDAGYRLDVNGTARVQGVLTLSSTITNGTYTYTLPGATGTLALTSQLNSGTVTSVAALTLGTTGTDLSSTVANGTTTPVITLNVPTANATNRGALSSADWTTFNNKQNAYTNLTSIGSLANAAGWLYNNGTGTFSYTSPTKSTVGLGNVENTALSTWAGTSNITTVGTLSSGSIPYSLLSGTVPTWNQNTTGTASNITATTNSTLTTLSSLSLPYSQVSGTPTIPTSFYLGTTSIALNRASGSQSLTGISIDGTASNITSYTINQNLGTTNSPTFAGGTLTGALSGTSGNFSSGITANTGFVSLMGVNSTATATLGYSQWYNGVSGVSYQGQFRFYTKPVGYYYPTAIFSIRGYDTYSGEGADAFTLTGAGAATFSSSVTAYSLIKSGGTSSQFLMADGSVNTSVLPSGAYLPLAGGTLTGTLYMGSNIYFTSNYYSINFPSSGSTIINNDGVTGNILFLSSSSLIRLSNTGYGGTATNGLIVTGDKVGIGTSSPSYLLDVNGTGNFSGALSGTSATFNSTLKVSGTSGDTYFNYGANGDNYITQGTSGTTTFRNATGTVYGTINSAGSVQFYSTLTCGALSGTSASFSSSVTATSASFSSNIGLAATSIISYALQDVSLRQSSNIWSIDNAGGTSHVATFNTGTQTTTLYGALSGTSASFSGNIATTGNIYLGGASANTWNNSYGILQPSSTTAVRGSNQDITLANNITYNSSWTYNTTGYGSALSLNSGGGLAFFTAPNGSGGGTATLTSVFSISNTGAATFSSSVTATAFYNSSDITLKDIISEDGDVIRYKWKDGRDDLIHIGYSAQEKQLLYPDQTISGENNKLTLNYTEILVDKVRQLEKKVESLKNLIK